VIKCFKFTLHSLTTQPPKCKSLKKINECGKQNTLPASDFLETFRTIYDSKNRRKIPKPKTIASEIHFYCLSAKNIEKSSKFKPFAVLFGIFIGLKKIVQFWTLFLR